MADNYVVLYEEDVPGAKLTKDLDDCSGEELKRWLQCHGLKKTGKKIELIEIVRLSIGIIKVDPKIDGGKWYEYKELVVSQKIPVQMFQFLQMIGNNFLLVIYRQCITMVIYIIT